MALCKFYVQLGLSVIVWAGLAWFTGSQVSSNSSGSWKSIFGKIRLMSGILIFQFNRLINTSVATEPNERGKNSLRVCENWV